MIVTLLVTVSGMMLLMTVIMIVTISMTIKLMVMMFQVRVGSR